MTHPGASWSHRALPFKIGVIGGGGPRPPQPRPPPRASRGGTQPRFVDCIAPQAYTAVPLFYLLKPVNCPVGLVPRYKLVLLHVPGGRWVGGVRFVRPLPVGLNCTVPRVPRGTAGGGRAPPSYPPPKSCFARKWYLQFLHEVSEDSLGARRWYLKKALPAEGDCKNALCNFSIKHCISLCVCAFSCLRM